MYAHIRGVVDCVQVDCAVIDAGGVGYELFCSGATLKRLRQGDEVKLYTHFHISQDNVALYGFYDTAERAMFRKLISVTRVGPKLALSVLSQLTPSDIAAAIVTENTAALSKVPGMGAKTAARVLLELKEKVTPEDMMAAGIKEPAGAEPTMRAEAVAALVALGYDGVSAGRAVAAVPECDRIEDMIKLALREFIKQR